MRDPLYAELEGVPVSAVAARLRLLEGARGSWGPCPACGAERRGSEDRRGPLGVSRDGCGWRCFRCDVHGDAAALVLAVATGGGTPGADGWARARELALEVGLVAPAGPPGGAGVRARVPPPPAPVRPVEARPAFADADEVAAVWSVAGRVDEDPEVAAWLRGRALDPEAVAGLDLARAYPDQVELAARVAEREGALVADGLDPARGAALAGAPGWAGFGPRGWSTGWRLLLPTWDPSGARVGVRARWTVPGDPPRVKEGGGTGIAAGPAVYADPVGRWLLAAGPGARVGDLAGDDRANPLGWRWSGVVALAEGGPDWLTLATAPARAVPGKATAAVLGVWSGGWSASFAARLPPGCTVRLATDPDDTGRAYAAKIRETLPAGCRVEVVT